MFQRCTAKRLQHCSLLLSFVAVDDYNDIIVVGGGGVGGVVVVDRYPFDVVDKETGQALPWPHAIKKPALEPMRFRKLKISAAAVSKMLQHAEVGISEGVATVGKPVEIMGVLVGYCDYANDEIVVVDSRRVPCAGGAHSAEPDPDTAVAMANISHELEQLYDNVVIIGWCVPWQM